MIIVWKYFTVCNFVTQLGLHITTSPPVKILFYYLIMIEYVVIFLNVWLTWSSEAIVVFQCLLGSLYSICSVKSNLNVLYFTVMELIWDCPRVTIKTRWLYY